MNGRWIRASSLVGLAALCVACLPSSGGIGGTGVMAKGQITGFGSIFVNGIEYNTDRAVVTLDGAPATAGQLQLGHVVVVKGRVNSNGSTGVANAVEYRSRVRGPITAVDLVAKSITVLGQTISTDSNTVINGSPAIKLFTDLAAGQYVALSGFPQSGGGLLATRIEVQPPSPNVELRGRITTVDPAAGRFSVGPSTTVLYTSLPFIPAIDQEVEVVGTALTLGGVTEITAQQVVQEVSEFEGAAEGEHFEFEGVVGAVDTTAATFTISSNVIRYEPGFAQGVPVQVGMVVSAEGYVRNGQLVANHLDYHLPGAMEFKSRLDSFDAGKGTVTLFGRVVKVNSMTIIERRADFFTLLPARPILSIRAYPSGNELIATRIEFEGANTATSLKGPPDAGSVDLAGRRFSIGSVRVQSSAALPAAIALGASVRATGSYSNGVFNATSVVLDD